jgi:hypothetical protein
LVASMVVPEDERVDALYALPLGEFVAARNALAKELSDADVRKLPKPTATAWALNQLARRAPDEVEALLEAGRRIAETQDGAVRGRGSEPFREAVQAERQAINPLLARARKLVRGETQVAKIAEGLRAAAGNPEVGEQLRLGRLSVEPTAAGFENVGEVEVDEAAEAAAAKARAERERHEAEKAAERAGRDADRLEAQAAETAARAEAMRAEAEAARHQAEDALHSPD